MREARRTRILFRLVVSTILASGVLFWLVGSPERGLAQQSPPDNRWYPFVHKKHVPEEWENQKEVPRDCMGCHDYAQNTGKRRDPRDLCTKCHASEKTGAPGPAMDVRPDSSNPRPLAEVDRNQYTGTFRHADHVYDTPLDCKSCHVESDGSAKVKHSKRMPIVRGFSECLKCHDPEGTSPEILKGKKRRPLSEFVSTLNDSVAMRFQPPFRHREHMSLEQLENPRECATRCHKEIRGTDNLDFARKRFDRGADSECTLCHVENSQLGGFQSLRIPTRLQRLPSYAKLTFAHADHLSDSAREEDYDIRKFGCLACHLRDDNVTDRDVFSAKDDFDSFEKTCAAKCHFHQKWERVDNHGEVNECLPCHDFDIVGANNLSPTMVSL